MLAFLEFQNLNKNDYLSKDAAMVWDAINDGRALQKPDEFLNRFSILMYADLKRYHYYYWFAFPAFVLPNQLKSVPLTNKTIPDDQNLTNQSRIIKLDSVCSTETCQMFR